MYHKNSSSKRFLPSKNEGSVWIIHMHNLHKRQVK